MHEGSAAWTSASLAQTFRKTARFGTQLSGQTATRPPPIVAWSMFDGPWGPLSMKHEGRATRLFSPRDQGASRGACNCRLTSTAHAHIAHLDRLACFMHAAPPQAQRWQVTIRPCSRCRLSTVKRIQRASHSHKGTKVYRHPTLTPASSDEQQRSQSHAPALTNSQTSRIAQKSNSGHLLQEYSTASSPPYPPLPTLPFVFLFPLLHTPSSFVIQS
ncbi:hypothetical protein V8E36_000057 [Tilletia maclaganii]